MPQLIQLLAFPISPRISDPRIFPATWNITFTAIQNNELVVHESRLCGCCWLDRVSQSTRLPTDSSRADLQTTASRAVSIHYRISRPSGGWKLVVARSFARINDQPSAPHRAIKPDRSGTCNSRSLCKRLGIVKRKAEF